MPVSLESIIEEYENIQEEDKWKDQYLSCRFDYEAAVYSSSIGRHPLNLKYNRYRDILPYDHSRIILKNNDETSYINANLVECKQANRRYILTQGPLKNTCEHFWQMVWEQNSKGIIMLNRIIEKGAIKCEIYYSNFDDESSDELNFGKFKISCISEQPHEDYVLRELDVYNSDINESRTIYHCHYTNWPDFGEPQIDSFIKFLGVCYDLEVIKSTGDIGPAIIHCSAGVGRSGTLALVDSVLTMHQLYSNQMPIGIIEVLLELRKGRMGLVQTHLQLQFAYESIIKGIQIQIFNQLENNKNGLNEMKRKSFVCENSSDDEVEYDNDLKEKIKRRKEKFTKTIASEQNSCLNLKTMTGECANEYKDDDSDSNSDDSVPFAKRDISTVIPNKSRPPAMILSAPNPPEDNNELKEMLTKKNDHFENTSTIQDTQTNQNIETESTVRQRKDYSEKQNRISSMVKTMQDKQQTHEEKQSNFYTKYKPYLIGSGLFLSGIIALKLYKNFFFTQS